MKNLTLSLAAIGSLSILATAPTHAQVLAAWNFENDTIAVNNSPAVSSGNGTASSIGMNIYPTPNVGVTTDDVLQGSTSDTGANGVADLSQIWRIRGQAGSNGAANGWSSLAPIGSQGAVFATSTVGVSAGSSLKVSFDWYATTQGEANLELAYTTNGTNWTDVPVTLGGSDTGLLVKTNTTSANTVMGSYLSDTKATTGGGQDWFTGLTATITDPNALNDANFAIEMVNASTGADDVSTQGTALNNSSGNWRFDNVSITAQAAPEPSSWALALLCAGGFTMLVRKQKAKRA